MKIDLSNYAIEVEDYALSREKVIKASRDLLRASKIFIYSVHRDEDVENKLSELMDIKKKLDEIIGGNSSLSNEGARNEAIQEYVEGMLFYTLLKKGELFEKPDDVKINDYLGGLCDLCGEVSRHVVMLAMKRDVEKIKFYHEVVEQIFGELMKFNLKNGSLRSKYDSVKYHLKNIENVLYDLNLKS